MKKKIILFISIIVLVILSVLFGTLMINKPEENKPEISDLGNGVYKEIITTSNKSSLSGHIIYNGILYYIERKDLNSEEGEYYLNTLDYQTGSKKSTKILDDKNAFCYLDKNIITCSNDTKNYAFDLNLNKVLESSISDDYYEAVIPYDKEYWEYANGILKKGNKTIKIPGYDESFAYTDYLALEENTFILFISSNEYYIYDVKANSLINTHEIKYMKYSSGFIFYTSYYYHLYDLKNNEEYTYDVNGLIAPNTTYFGAFANDNLYQISNNTNSIETYNTKNNKVSSFDISSYLKYPISNFENKEDTLLMTTFLDEELEFIVIEMANHKPKEKNIYDYLTDQNKEITETIKAIKDKYNVNIKIKDEGEIIFPDFKSESLYTNSVIKSTLKKVEHILRKFPDNFFNQFHHDTYKGLNIYLSGSLTPSYPETQASNPVAYTLMQDYSYTIVLDSFYSELENTVCHELMQDRKSVV